MESNSQMIIYQTEDGKTKLEVRLENETVWLTQKMMAELFQTTKQNISLHIQNIYEEAELTPEATVKKYLTVQTEGTRKVERAIDFYNLDMILSVGYRIRSNVATKFRQWATALLKEYIIKGFTMNDEFLKNSDYGVYFEDLLQRIRDIRSSEKVFWRKVLDIYSTSIDYDAKTEMTKEFFRTVQNKMHWAAHGQTAAEVVYNRADSNKPNMGLTSFRGNKPTIHEAEVAKNYLNEEELNILNRIVTAYLEIAEIQALNQKPMYMKDWKEKLDEFLSLTGKEILNHKGLISHEQALEKAKQEYSEYNKIILNEISAAEKDFIKQLEIENQEILKKIEGKRK